MPFLIFQRSLFTFLTCKPSKDFQTDHEDLVIFIGKAIEKLLRDSSLNPHRGNISLWIRIPFNMKMTHEIFIAIIKTDISIKFQITISSHSKNFDTGKYS